VYRLEHRREVALWVEVRRRRDADAAGDRGGEVGEDVAEQVRTDDHVEPRRVEHYLGDERVDVLLVPGHGRVPRAGLDHQLVPERHGVHDPVRLGGGSDVPAPGFGQLEGVVEDPGDAGPGEDRLLYGHLVGEASVEPAADLGVLALDVLPHHHEVHVGGRLADRARHALEYLDRPQVDVLAELAADRDQQAPQRNVVRHAGPADGTEQDRVVVADAVQPVRGHHRALRQVTRARPVELVVVERDAVAGADPVEDGTGRWQHLGADAVAGDERDAVVGHAME
jgi:hypothetical protein